MIDWHTHVLPSIDDGSQSVNESLLMLSAMGESGIDVAVATPHFYADDESVEEFLARRERAFSELSAAVTDGMPRVVCGAEVKYYPGIARMAGLERLCIENTRLLLLEMPAAKWTDYTLSELNELALTRRLKVVLAHVERYLSLQDSATLDKLFDSDIYMQTNASCFLRFATRAKALRRLEAAEIQFVGSDCHNMTSRAPNADKAYALIEKKLGGRFAARLDSFGRDMLEEI